MIKILSENLVNQIAAGEVVERPASVVKELMDNSLDSYADTITVEIKDGGRTLIKVSDNGSGMSPEDLEMSLMRHATSKISDESDLWKIGTMGFRGEALASIASVSKMSIKSRTAESVGGHEIHVEGGDKKQMNEIGMSQGTTVEVMDLFFNTPARQKYLKNESTEFSKISETFNAVALAHPKMSFKLIHNGKVVTELPRVTDFLSRIGDVFGKATSDAMLPIFYGGSEFQIEGYIGKPLLSRSSAKHQYFFVNGRPIQHFLLANTIKSAYHSMLMEHKKPVFAVNIKIDPSLIDVNVHPRKIEIRFEDQNTLVRVMYGAVKKALEGASLIPKGFSESRRYMSDGLPTKEAAGNSFGSVASFGGGYGGGFGGGSSMSSPAARSVSTQDAMDFSAALLEERAPAGIASEVRSFSMRPVLQVSNSYIVAEAEDGLILIDQHAAHERVRFEELMAEYDAQEKSKQPLLVPAQLELSVDEAEMLKEHGEIFSGLGFEIENFGGNTFLIQAVPSCLVKEEIDEVIKGVLDDLADEKKPSNMQGHIEEILTYMSCRSAIKFGQKLNLPEMEALIKQMDGLERPYTCPHGRPTMVALTMDELGKMFGRK
ncbi:hypothetical protein COU74_00190 [Candidatus Peregrinibacteria bacterium CG10_big_fil_rev_8_21_14_0_10_36_19]|nr:MAG: hypothetical protein COU74_00190 [Candidatus Peregrinibacteria bacterium CG10_big_fil_rev_8_21_14_0_10_36_19]